MVNARKWLSAYGFTSVLLVGVAVGCGLGLWLGPRAEVLKPLGDAFLNVMFTVVVPLVFFSIASAVASVGSGARLGKVMSAMLVVFVATGVVASLSMIVAVKLFPPAQGATLAALLPKAGSTAAGAPESLSAQIVAALTVPDFQALLSRRNMLPLIVFSVLFGTAATLAGDAGRRVAQLLDSITTVMVELVNVVMWAAPVGLGAYFAALVGVHGPSLVGNYGRAMALYYPMAFMYFFVMLTAVAWIAGGRVGLSNFWKAIVPAAATALATGSSVATIPANLEASRRIGVPRDIRELVVPIGATIHMDGSCLSAVLKIAFLFGLYGQAFDTPMAYATAVGVAILSGTVMAGIPGGGFVGEMMIVTLYGFPPESLAILTTIGALVDPPATLINSTGDTAASMLVTRIIEGKGPLQVEAEHV